MSLIHEALKRVQTNKPPAEMPGPVELSTSDATAPPAPPEGSVSPYAPQSPTGSPQAARPGPVPPPWLTMGHSAPPPLVPPPAPSGPSRILFSRSPIFLALGLAVAVGATLIMMSIVQREMGLPAAASAGSRAKPAAQATTPPQKAAAAKAVAQESVRAATAPPAVVQMTETPAATSAPAAPALLSVLPPPAPVPEEKTPPARSNNPPAAAARFRVSGIMSGPTGGAALINGRMIYVGQEIDGARLVRTTANTVMMEMDGVQFTLGISP
jgi:hypothetical protein